MQYRFSKVDESKEYDYEELVHLAVELLSYGVQRLRLAISQIDTSGEHTGRERALLKWHIYLAVLSVDYVDAVVNLAPIGIARPMQTLNRSVFEYLTKARFFAANPKVALEQFKAMDARMFIEMGRLDHPSKKFTDELTERFEEWKTNNPAVTSYDGAKRFVTMCVSLASPYKVRQDPSKSGSEFTHELQIHYAIPSLIAHGDAAMMEDVLPRVRDKDGFEFRYESGAADTLQELQKTIRLVDHWLVHLARTFKMPASDIVQLARRGAILFNLDLARRRRRGDQYIPEREAPLP
jgi:hypothetical protein